MPIASITSRPQLFLASSEQAKPLAMKLKAKLDPITDVLAWWEAFGPGGTTLSTLLQHARSCDFAAVLFTADDIYKDKNDNAIAAPRDNCVFELGLFMGALGLNSERSLLLRSDDSGDLLSDLKGLTYIRLPSANCSAEEEENFLKLACEQINRRIKDLKFCFQHPNPNLSLVPKQRLIDLETSQVGGNLLESDDVEVLINAAQPMELNHEIARKVCRNMDDDVSYSYCFYAEDTSIGLFSSLISNLAAACVDQETPGRMNSEQRKSLMTKYEAQVERQLDNMQQKVRVYFLHKRPYVEFCVHNANHENEAICYLRHSKDAFVEWRKGNPAKYVADELKRKWVNDRDTVFQGSYNYSLYDSVNEGFLTKLKSQTLQKFPTRLLQDKVTKICFGKNV